MLSSVRCMSPQLRLPRAQPNTIQYAFDQIASWSANDSVTSVPPSADGASSYFHTLSGVFFGLPTPKANTRFGSHSVTLQTVQYVGPFSLRFTCPRNVAPTAGPVAPSSHSASNTSGLKRPVWVTSLTRSQIFSAGAFMWTVTEPCMTGTLGRDEFQVIGRSYGHDTQTGSERVRFARRRHAGAGRSRRRHVEWLPLRR